MAAAEGPLRSTGVLASIVFVGGAYPEAHGRCYGSVTSIAWRLKIPSRLSGTNAGRLAVQRDTFLEMVRRRRLLSFVRYRSA